MDIGLIQKCTYCGNIFPDFRIALSMSTEVFRKTSADTIEEIDNMKFNTSEVLCMDCYNKFTEKLTEFMEARSV